MLVLIMFNNCISVCRLSTALEKAESDLFGMVFSSKKRALRPCNVMVMTALKGRHVSD